VLNGQKREKRVRGKLREGGEDPPASRILWSLLWHGKEWLQTSYIKGEGPGSWGVISAKNL